MHGNAAAHRATRSVRSAWPAGRRRQACAALAAVLVTGWALLLPGYDGSIDRAIVTGECLATVLLAAITALSPSRRARHALALLTTYIGLTALGDTYWLLTVDPTGLSFVDDDFEPGPTIAVEVVRYAALLGLLAHATPVTGGRRWTWRRGVSQAQTTVSVAALLLLATPAGALVDDGRSYSLFCFFDIAVAATALGAVLGAAWTTPRPDRGATRHLAATAAGVGLVVLGDAVVVLSLTAASTATGAAGMAAVVAGGGTLLAVNLRTGHPAPAPPGALPHVPRPGHPGLVLTVTVVVQVLTPLAVSALTAARLTAAAQPGSSAGPGAATVGTAVAALALTVLHATAQSHRARLAQVAAAAAHRDELTGAHSRRGLSAHAHRHLDTTTGPGWTLALFDLDGFKAVNDTFGHDAGDEVLRAVVARAAAVVDGHGVLARLGGDEFVALLRTGPADAPATTAVLERLREAVAVPVEVPGGVTVAVGASLGAVTATPGPTGLAGLLSAADRRMYADKRTRRPTPQPPAQAPARLPAQVPTQVPTQVPVQAPGGGAGRPSR
ncbi:GGDEF domain-containing protein [Kineococcus arenarius]|uniref:GGDEF domain-containing protein n=1 Tax=unclassified Kineococcus TaxID=2621656 RepID=UPI003D7CCA30